MHEGSLTRAAEEARTGGRKALAAALAASRADTLATFAACERALPGLEVPQATELNPPLWELGHVGWFQTWWVGRNPDRQRGIHADPDAPRLPPARAGADALYDSSRVPHASRWSLPLPDADATRRDLAAQLAETQALLEHCADSDEALYFHRLVLLHEDMHHEAALYMAQRLAVPIEDPRWRPAPLPAPGAALACPAGPWRLGRDPGQGFAFDNELPQQAVEVGAVSIDAQAVRWAEYLPFIEAGGYGDDRWWSADGRAWREATETTGPRCLRRRPVQANATGLVTDAAPGDRTAPAPGPGPVPADTGAGTPHSAGWERRLYGRWQPLDHREAACHLSLHEAEAWCRWAGRRLPTEAEWERAACTAPGFRWGDVWEWTASPFAPYPGFVPHPYRDYSAPWFDGRPVLRGASFMTQPRLRHPRYRNYFPAHRSDVPAGFRSCAI